MALIELSGVDVRFGAVHALRGVDAAIDGEIIGLLGENGAGKSTLLKCLLGLVRFGGSARVLDLDVGADAFRIRERVGYMPEADVYLEGLTAVELCTYAAELSGLPPAEAMQRAHAALYYAGLEDKRYQRVDGYSTGMKQRVKLAQALVHDPALLFLDEPTNGLDPRARDEMLELILELPEKRGCAIILSTHLLRDVERVCDHAVVLSHGQLRFSGPIADLLRAHADDRVYELELKRGEDAFYERLRGAGCEVLTRTPERMVVTLPAGESPALLFQTARDAHEQIRGLRLERESLEQAFLRIVGEKESQATVVEETPE